MSVPLKMLPGFVVAGMVTEMGLAGKAASTTLVNPADSAAASQVML